MIILGEAQRAGGHKGIGIYCQNGGSALKCWICGKKATRTLCREDITGAVLEREPTKWIRCYCEDCRDKVQQQERDERAQYIKLKKKEMFRKACDKLERQHTDMYDYKEAIDTVEEYFTNNPDKFDSSYEVLAAIVLIKNRFHIKPQYRIGSYQVDFLLPEYSLVLEIDGDRHKNRKEYDSGRDQSIKNQLGNGWNIMRVKTEYMDMDAKKLPTAIDKFLDYKEEKHINWRTI